MTGRRRKSSLDFNHNLVYDHAVEKSTLHTMGRELFPAEVGHVTLLVALMFWARPVSKNHRGRGNTCVRSQDSFLYCFS